MFTSMKKYTKIVWQNRLAVQNTEKQQESRNLTMDFHCNAPYMKVETDDGKTYNEYKDFPKQ